MRKATLPAVLIAAAVLLGGCSKPWTHPDYSGSLADQKFKEDSLTCEVQAGEAFPLEKREQNKQFLMCMSDLGWSYHPEGQGFTFRTKPR
ncbi:hypothetical protein [Pseudodesulfovibrio indicus]|uniref:hypothetical protein n=1 Tax=Pseudodesulfovibrio indicus TaxID=1716143 RepID=UPI00292DB44C|nr:hypothetical protein [Pseudodesulfovibrio indicus]